MSELITVKITDLKQSIKNVRKGHTRQAIIDMARSIKENGVINPPTIVADGVNQYEIIAGQLRVFGAELNGDTEIDCILRPAAATAVLIQASLAENTDREPMSETEVFVALQALRKSGRTVAEIGASFNMTEKAVLQSLAIGTLPKGILKLAEQDKIWDDGLKVLTTATRKQLAMFVKMKASDRPRSGWQIKKWLDEQSKRITVQHALFPVDDYKGAIIDDLFARDNEARQFADADEFWKLQNPCIEAAHARLEKAGWLVQRTDEWRAWDYDKVKKADGGQAFIAVMSSGEVIITKGVLPSAQARRATAKPGNGKPAPELTGPMQDYMRAHRHLALQEAITINTDLALALAITLIITGDRGWQAEPETFGTMRNEKHRAGINESIHRSITDQACAGVHEDLNIDPDAVHWDIETIDVLNAALSLPSKRRESILATLVANRLRLPFPNDDSDVDDRIAEIAGIGNVSEWRADDLFWAGIRSRAALIGILTELAPDAGWEKNKKSTLAQLRKAAKKIVYPEWLPRWLRFPAQGYTEQHGLPFVSKADD